MEARILFFQAYVYHEADGRLLTTDNDHAATPSPLMQCLCPRCSRSSHRELEHWCRQKGIDMSKECIAMLGSDLSLEAAIRFQGKTEIIRTAIGLAGVAAPRTSIYQLTTISEAGATIQKGLNLQYTESTDSDGNHDNRVAIAFSSSLTPQPSSHQPPLPMARCRNRHPHGAR